MKCIILTTVILLGISQGVYAQAPASPTDYVISHHLASTPDSISITTPYSFPKTSPALSCNQPRIANPVGTQINPRFYRWDDPDNVNTDCVFDKTLATSPLFTDPPAGGEYVARIVAVAKVGSVNLISTISAPSNPFVRGTIPSVVLHLRTSGQ